MPAVASAKALDRSPVILASSLGLNCELVAWFAPWFFLSAELSVLYASQSHVSLTYIIVGVHRNIISLFGFSLLQLFPTSFVAVSYALRFTRAFHLFHYIATKSGI